MKGYETAFDICEKVNEDEKIKDEKLLIYPGGWRDDFLSIIIKDFDEYNDTVDYAIAKVKKELDGDENWYYLKDEYDESSNQVLIQYKMKEKE